MRTLTRVAAVCVIMSVALALSLIAHEDTTTADRAHFAI